MGIAILLHESNPDSAHLLIANTLASLENQVAEFLEQLRKTSDNLSFTLPDEEIVEQLCGRGYSLNSAKRAATMTNNASFASALTWAVTHFTDTDFDEQMVYVKQESAGELTERRFVDENLINMVKESLHTAQSVINRRQSETDGNQHTSSIDSSSKIDSITNESLFSMESDECDLMKEMEMLENEIIEGHSLDDRLYDSASGTKNSTERESQCALNTNFLRQYEDKKDKNTKIIEDNTERISTGRVIIANKTSDILKHEDKTSLITSGSTEQALSKTSVLPLEKKKHQRAITEAGSTRAALIERGRQTLLEFKRGRKILILKKEKDLQRKVVALCSERNLHL